MGVMDKFLDALHLNNEDEDDYDEDDFYDEGEIVDNTVRKPMAVLRNDDYDEPAEKPRRASSSQKVTPIRPVKKTSANGMEVCVIKPSSIEDAREITETLLANRTVVLNLEGLDVEIAQRIIDFTSGSTYAISGNLQKISNYIFIITPACVDISGDFQEIFASGSFDVPPMSRGTY